MVEPPGPGSEFRETHLRRSGIFLGTERLLVRKTSKFQTIEIYETTDFGRMLVLDGMVMTTERDEYLYHEMLVHPAMVLAASIESVLIIGGGDGGTLREVSKYSEVQRITLVELDEEVVRLSRQFLPTLSTAFDDPRVTLHFEDGMTFLQRTQARYSVIFVDSPDPVGPAEVLFSRPFYELLADHLEPEGILVAQTESPFYHQDLIRSVVQSLKGRFPTVQVYLGPVITYPSGTWTYTLATRIPKESLGPKRPVAKETRWFHDELISTLFVLPKELAHALG